MSREMLEQALRNWQDKIAYFERQLSITDSPGKKFELRKEIKEYEQDIERIQASIKLHDSEFISGFLADECMATIAQEVVEQISKNKQSQDDFCQEIGEKEAYLITTLEPFDEKRKEFLFNGWLIIGEPKDNSEYLDRCQSLLNHNENESGIKCELSQVEIILDNFIERCFAFLPKDHKLIIEIFLPIDLLETEVEWWNIKDYDYSKTPIGTKYPVRLRSIERLDERYLQRYLYQWQQKWQKAKSVLRQQPTQQDFGHLDLIKDETFTIEYLLYELEEKIGLKLTSCPPRHKRQDLFKAILKSTIPIALWTRYYFPEQNKEIDKLFVLKPLCFLCDSIKKKRMEALAQRDEVQKQKHLGSHLALLWENPYRLTPDVMVELIPPGQ